MEFLELKNISEVHLNLLNPVSEEKVLVIGKYAGLNASSRVIDFGCGFGEALALWGKQFGVSGTGVEIRPFACQRARQRLQDLGLQERFEIVCASGSDYHFEPAAYDLAACIGATFIWGGFQSTIQALKPTLRTGGMLAIGEPYWLKQPVPADYTTAPQDVHSERELLQIAHAQGCEMAYLARASNDDWDRYSAGNWFGLLQWIEANPEHAERQQVIDHLHESQEEYLRFEREYLGWAIYLLKPVSYLYGAT